MDRMKELVELLNRYAEMYYTYDAPIIADAEYDKLYDELKALEEFTGVVLPNSPTRRVGGETLKEFKEYRHSHKLYSLDKCQSKEEFALWASRTEKTLGYMPELTVEYKFDGLTVNLVYEGGNLISAATRGNGLVGEDITAQAKTIKNVPQTIDYKGHVEVQGEGIMRLSVLEKYNKKYPDDRLKNARNAAAGAIRNLDPKVTAKRNLDVMCYNAEGDPDFSTQAEMRDFIIKNGFGTVEYFKTVKTVEDAYAQMDEIEKARPTLDFLIDGIVFKVNDVSARETLGETEKFPKWAVAYKFKAEEATTVMKDVVWQVSRTGKLTPLAVLEPVDLCGTTVRRATLNNYGDILKKKVKIGSRVFIRRSNDVIPEILGVAEDYPDSKPVEKPKFCPECGSPVREENVFLYCTNDVSCAPQIVSKITHFAEKAAMNIEGLSDRTVEQLYNDLQVKEFSDLYRLTFDELMTLDGFKDKKAQNLLDSIEKSKETTLQRFLYALGIPNIGQKAAKELAKKFGTLDAVKSATVEDIQQIDDFGEIMAKSVVNYFEKPANSEQLRLLEDAGVRFVDSDNSADDSGSFAGLRVVLTGTLSKFKRSEAQKLIEDRGGEVLSTISSKVNLVVAGEEAGSKLQKALKAGIKIVDEAEFESML